MALVKGVIDNDKPILVRVHALDLLSDVLGDQSSNRSGSELSRAMELIAIDKNGIIILIRDSSPASLSKNIAQSINQSNHDTYQLRDYGVGAQILIDLGVKNMTILSNSKKMVKGLEGFGLTIKNWKKLG
jgi:3,4-dihydroxy 2-butanone 4-phosphate synthase/GTP cyclohydrolase II